LTAVMTETPMIELNLAGGLAGFPAAARFALIELPEASPLFLLRSLDEPGLEFVVAPPGVFFPDYTPEVDDASADRLALTDAADALLLVVLTIQGGIDTATANLLAPIVINQRTRAAAQVIVQGDWPLRAPLRRS
jgi:flagellar assembly factor FliW